MASANPATATLTGMGGGTGVQAVQGVVGEQARDHLVVRLWVEVVGPRPIQKQSFHHGGSVGGTNVKSLAKRVIGGVIGGSGTVGDA